MWPSERVRAATTRHGADRGEREQRHGGEQQERLEPVAAGGVHDDLERDHAGDDDERGGADVVFMGRTGSRHPTR